MRFPGTGCANSPAMLVHFTARYPFSLVTYLACKLYEKTIDLFVAAQTLSDDDDDDEISLDGESLHIDNVAKYTSSDFEPTPGGPFSALTPSMWPQDIIQRLSDPVRVLYSIKTKNPRLTLRF